MPGTTQVTDGVFFLSDVRDTATQIKTTTGKFLNGDFQITFVLSNVGVTVDPAPGYNPPTNIPFTHIPGGTLDVYVEDLDAPGAVQANPNLTTGDGSGLTGFTAGTLVASFVNVAGTGNINLTSQDGNDDAFWAVTYELPNVVLDANGNDLLALPGLILKTDDTYDFSSGNGPFGLGPPTSGLGSTVPGTTPDTVTDFYSSVSGKANSLFQSPYRCSFGVCSGSALSGSSSSAGSVRFNCNLRPKSGQEVWSKPLAPFLCAGGSERWGRLPTCQPPFTLAAGSYQAGWQPAPQHDCGGCRAACCGSDYQLTGWERVPCQAHPLEKVRKLDRNRSDRPTCIRTRR